MKRTIFYIFIFCLFSSLFGQLNVSPDSTYINIEPDEIIYANFYISNIGSVEISFSINVNYISGNDWIGIFNPNSGIIWPGQTFYCSFPVSSYGLINTTVMAELIISNSAGQDIIVPVTLVVNPLQTFNPPQNLFVDQFGYATWDSPEPNEYRDLMGYNIYLDGCFVGFCTDYFWIYEGLTPGQTYIAGISAIYDDPPGESEIVNFNFYYYPFLNPVQNLFITEIGYAIWEPPDLMEESRDFLGYNVYLNVNFITFTTNEFYDYELNDLIPGELYVGSVTAVYNEGESTTEWCPFQYLPEPFYPPENLTFNELTGYCTWEEPVSCYNVEGYYIYLDDMTTPVGTTTNTWWQVTGLTAGQSYTIGLQTVYDVGESEIITITIYPVNAGNSLITQTCLLGNYPNPFNPTTSFKFSLAAESSVKLNIYNLRGQLVKQLLSNNLPAGVHTVLWNGNDSNDKQVSSGIYYSVMDVNDNGLDYISVKKIILHK